MKVSTLNLRFFQSFLFYLVWIVIVVVVFLISLSLRDVLTAAVSSAALLLLGLAVSGQLRGNMLLNPRNHVIITLSVATLATIIVNASIQVNFSAGIHWAGLLRHWPLYTSAIALWMYARRVILDHEGLADRIAPVYLKQVPFRDRAGEVFLSVSEISHIQADGDYIKVYVGERYYLIRQTLKDILQDLDPTSFRRIHRSTIVNLAFIDILKPHRNSEYFVYLTDGTELKLSRSYRDALEDFSLA